MSKADHSITLMMLVDALRPDYLVHAPYLRSLASRSATGALRECFGFVPRQAYFGGLDAEQYGFTNMFCFDPANSPFKMARGFPSEIGTGVRREFPGTRRLVEERAKEQLSFFAKNYGTSVEIPLPYLPYFDLVERRAPWDRQVGYRSCFAILDELGIPWMQWMWPDTNKLSNHSDRGIVDQVLKDLRPEHRLLCVHLQELDALGHAHGPNSAQLQDGVMRTDREVERLVERLREQFARVKVVLFGDHGMVNVTRTLDVAAAIEGLGLRFGVDYAYFLDSTMARFWFYHADARTEIERVLRGMPGGQLLDAAGMAHYEIAGCDPKNGELIFLAHPGVLIFPNFFQASGRPIPGMHGYDPDCADNLGFFLLHDEEQPELAGAELGKVNPPAIFPLLLHGVGLKPEDYTSVSRPSPRPKTSSGRFTQSRLPEADLFVSGLVERIAAAVTEKVGEVEAIVLTGGFGRGEGGVYQDQEGRLRPVNDFDVTVVSERPIEPLLKGIGAELARELSIDFVDLGYSDGRWSNLPLTIFNYDLRYGSRVVSGNPAVLDRVPRFASANLSPYEFVRLLLNRTAGLLSGLRGAHLVSAPSADEQRYLTNQVIKAYIAVGDWYLGFWKGYDSSYLKRCERFMALAPGAGIAPDLVEKIAHAYWLKCHPDYSCFAAGYSDVADLFPYLAEALVSSIGAMTGNSDKTLGAAMNSYLAVMGPPTTATARDNQRCAGHCELAEVLAPGATSSRSLRHTVMAVLPLVLDAANFELRPQAAEEARALLSEWFKPIERAETAVEDWEALRAISVKAWFALCH